MWHATNKSHRAIAKIAKKDIPIIKVGTRIAPEIFMSNFMCAVYQLNKLVPRVKIIPYDTRINYISEGYHFYKPNLITIRRDETIRSSDGLYPLYICSRFEPDHTHYVFKPDHADYVFGVETVIAKGFIPKGTVYYLNSRGEGVAEQICLTEMIKL